MENKELFELASVEALIFDMDGTLWDSVDTIVEAWNRGMRVLGRPESFTRENLSTHMGKTVEEIRAISFPDLASWKAEKAMNLLFEIENDLIKEKGGELYPAVPECLKALSESHKLMIVSNCGNGYIEAFLDFYQLGELILDHECNGGTGLPKGENIRLIMERNQIKSAAYVGDTITDWKATEEAGVPFIYASYGFRKVPEEHCALVLKEFEDLVKS